MNRAEVIHQNFLQRVAHGDYPQAAVKNSDSLSAALAIAGVSERGLVDLFETQLMSRLLDLTSRRLAARKESFYTIGSAGHEGNAAFGRIFRPDDLAFLHYRDAAFLIQRSKFLTDGKAGTPLYNLLLSFAASRDDPVSGGRHKVLGSKALFIPPQTSTIASHLPKAVGAAHSLGIRKAFADLDTDLPQDSIILCSFGDASANHSTAQGAFNTACWAAYQNSPMPIVFVCEDNGLGISTPTPSGWIEAAFSQRPGLKYLACDGRDLVDCLRVGRQAETYTRKHRKPVFLHFKTVRLTGHAGSDAEIAYRSMSQIEAAEADDPLLHSARLLVELGVLSCDDILQMYQVLEARITRIAEKAIGRPKLCSAREVMLPIVAQADRYREHRPPPSQKQRQTVFHADQRALSQSQHMAKLINLTLADVLLQYSNVFLCGEDIGRKGGVYGVTQTLQKKFGPGRVTDTLLDEQSILGMAIGAAHVGLLAIPEIQFLAYVHNAEDQIRGEAATLSFFSNSQFTNGMVVRIAGLAYQKGFGGHFHNDNSLAVFRDIPGVILACPSNGHDAVHMLRTCVDLAYRQHRVVIFLEPIALYMTRDLHAEGDGLWTHPYEPPGETMPIMLGEPNVISAGTDFCILTYGNGFYLSRKATKILENEGIEGRVVDLRWLAPLDEPAILEAVRGYDNVLIVDECRKSGSISEALVALLHEQAADVTVKRLTALDSFIPLGAAAHLVLPDVSGICDAVREITGGSE